MVATEVDIKDIAKQFINGKKIYIGSESAQLIGENTVYAEAYGEQTRDNAELIYLFTEFHINEY